MDANARNEGAVLEDTEVVVAANRNADLDAAVWMFLARLLLALVLGVMAMTGARVRQTQRMVPLGEWTWQEMG